MLGVDRDVEAAGAALHRVDRLHSFGVFETDAGVIAEELRAAAGGDVIFVDAAVLEDRGAAGIFECDQVDRHRVELACGAADFGNRDDS